MIQFFYVKSLKWLWLRCADRKVAPFIALSYGCGICSHPVGFEIAQKPFASPLVLPTLHVIIWLKCYCPWEGIWGKVSWRKIFRWFQVVVFNHGVSQRSHIGWEDPFGGCKTNNFEPQPGNSYTSYTLKSDKSSVCCHLAIHPFRNVSVHNIPNS